MDHVTALVERDQDPQTLAAARSIARLLDVGTTVLHLPARDGPAAVRTAVRALGAGDVRAAVLSARGDDPVCWQVISRVSGPAAPGARTRRDADG